MGLVQSSCSGDKDFGNGLYVEWGHATMQGLRDSHEDDFVITPALGGNNHVAVFSLFDGHYGRRAAKYAAKNLHKVLSESEQFLRGEYKKALRACFLDFDRQLLNKSRKSGWQDGTTALTAVVVDDPAEDCALLVVANAGDCRAILFKGEDTIDQITVDHNPSLKVEKKRITDAGGIIRYGRIEDRLAVSRGFGDRQFKEPRPLVSATPDLFRIPLRSDEAKFIVLACDGVWNFLSNVQVGKYVHRELSAGQHVKEVTKGLIKLAYDQGSTDNISAIVIKLKHSDNRPTPVKAPQSEPFPRKSRHEAKKASSSDSDEAAASSSSADVRAKRKSSRRSQQRPSSAKPSSNRASQKRTSAPSKSEPTKRRSQKPKAQQARSS